MIYETAKKEKQLEKLKEELKECSFVPQINEGAPSRRRSGIVVHDALYEQGRRISRDKKLRDDKSTEQVEYERSKPHLTFKPEIARLPLEPTNNA